MTVKACQGCTHWEKYTLPPLEGGICHRASEPDSPFQVRKATILVTQAQFYCAEHKPKAQPSQRTVNTQPTERTT